MPSGILNTGAIGFLDNIRINNGPNCLKNYFRNLLTENVEKAAELINDSNLHYCSLFVLRPELNAIELAKRLSGRNKMALRITGNINIKDSKDMSLLTQDRNEFAGSVLKWILGTGYREDSLTDMYEEVMEQTAILLTRTYKDTELLNLIAEMIFSRNRKGLFVHHLIWAFFEADSANSLMLLADRLLSTEKCDIELAKKLLAFIPDLSEGREMRTATLHSMATDWIRNNLKYIQYTGESLHQAVNPVHYTVPGEPNRIYRPYLTSASSHKRPAEINYNTLKADYPERSIERNILEKLAASEKKIEYDSVEELKFELALRRSIVDASYALYRGRMRFSVFRKSECNRNFWTRMLNGGFKLKDDVLPSDGIRDIYRNTEKYATECATAMMIVFYKAVLDVYGEELFNKTFPEIILMDWMHTENKMGVSTYRTPAVLLPGDCRYFKNPDVDPMSPEWQGENAIDLGDGTYYGHGIGIKNEDGIIRVLNKYRVYNSEVSAYLMNSVTRPDFKELFKNKQ